MNIHDNPTETDLVQWPYYPQSFFHFLNKKQVNITKSIVFMIPFWKENNLTAPHTLFDLLSLLSLALTLYKCMFDKLLHSIYTCV